MNLVQSAINFWNGLFPSSKLSEDATHEEVAQKMQSAPTFEQLKEDIVKQVTTSFETQINDLTQKVNSFEQKVNELEQANSTLLKEKETLESQLSEFKQLNTELTEKNKVLAQDLATLKASNQVVKSDEQQDSGLSKFTTALKTLTGESKY